METFKRGAKVTTMNFYIDKSPIHGKGIFASKRFEKGDFITKTHVLIENWRGKIGNGWVNIKPNCMYNHSARANCVSVTEKIIDDQVGQLQKNLYALGVIVGGEELLVDFAKDDDLEQPREGWKAKN